MTAFGKPKGFFVVEAFFVGQPVAGFFIQQADAYLFISNADEINQVVVQGCAGNDLIALLFDDVDGRAGGMLRRCGLRFRFCRLIFAVVTFVVIAPVAVVSVFRLLAAVFFGRFRFGGYAFPGLFRRRVKCVKVEIKIIAVVIVKLEQRVIERFGLLRGGAT